MTSLALLIGGRGRRLGGVDKTRIILPSGATTAETLLALFEPLVDDVFGVGRADQATHPLSRTIRLLAEEPDGQGPLRGVATALAASRTPWVFVVACDLVHVTADDLRLLMANRTRGCLAIAWRAPSGSEPLCALYHRALATTAQRLLARGERRAKALLDGARFLERATPIANLNTSDDVATAKANLAKS